MGIAIGWKKNLNFVLVGPREAGNIGAAARAIKNMGFFNLALVTPKEGKFPSDEAVWYAHGAEDVLAATAVYASLADALRDAALVVGTTRRTGRHRGPVLSIKEAAAEIRQRAARNRVAVLFGREDRGLLNKETAECAFLINIPTDQRAMSLNLAQAVLITAYETAFSEFRAGLPKTVTHQELALFCERLDKVLKLVYRPRGDRDLEAKIMKNLKHLTARAGLKDWELKMLHGLVSQLAERLGGE